MLNHLRQRVAAALAPTRYITLASSGPAGVRASRLPCETQDTRLFVLVPATSDHLFNLEHQPRVALAGESWELQGSARILLPCEQPAGLFTSRLPEAGRDVVVEIRLERLTLTQADRWGANETLELI